jgi:FkbM family methyltransferase
MLNTNQKVSIARMLSKTVVSARRLSGAPSTAVVRRGGVLWSLDLKEGIDLSIYLLGGFEPRTLRRYKELIADGFVVLDIGANIGAHTLPIARLVGPSGKVIAFEPTKYASEKLLNNIRLNPRLSNRIVFNQTMLVGSISEELPKEIYSSWPLEKAGDLHSDHQGRLKSTIGAIAQTLDSYAEQHNLDRVDFIKLDVDGHEYEVLQGARDMLEKLKPSIMLELAPYVYSERPSDFDDLLRLLWDMGYRLTNLATGALLPRNPNEVRSLIPSKGGMNSLAYSA